MVPMPSAERRILDALPITIYTVDLDGRITNANRSWSRFAQNNGAPQLSDPHVRGNSIWDAIGDPAAREQVERAMELLRTGRSSTVSWEFPCSSPEEERVFLLQLAPLRDDHTVTGFVFSTVDITPSHRSREALIDAGIALARTIALERVYQEVSRQIRRAIPCDALAIALAGDDPEVLHLAYQWGFDAEPAAIEERFGTAWRTSLDERRVIDAAAGDALELTAPMTGADSVVGAISLHTSPIDSPQRRDEVERVLATLAAQTAAAIERAWLVRRVEHKRRLEAIGEVAAGVAHELRNPLFGISSAAQLLRFRAREDPVVEKNVGRILREVERLNRMVTALLEYGRPHPLRLTSADPDEVWDDVIEGNRGLLESRALRLHRTRATPGVHMLLDVEQIAQVFLNVLVNGIDAAPEASDLTLASTTLGHGGWRCRLRNGGAPIPAETLARVFEVFFSTKPGGTGIGLALCQRIVEEHRGTITLESVPESGTTCTIVLPGVPAGA